MDVDGNEQIEDVLSSNHTALDEFKLNALPTELTEPMKDTDAIIDVELEEPLIEMDRAENEKIKETINEMAPTENEESHIGGEVTFLPCIDPSAPLNQVTPMKNSKKDIPQYKNIIAQKQEAKDDVLIELKKDASNGKEFEKSCLTNRNSFAQSKLVPLKYNTPMNVLPGKVQKYEEDENTEDLEKSNVLNGLEWEMSLEEPDVLNEPELEMSLEEKQQLLEAQYYSLMKHAEKMNTLEQQYTPLMKHAEKMYTQLKTGRLFS